MIIFASPSPAGTRVSGNIQTKTLQNIPGAKWFSNVGVSRLQIAATQPVLRIDGYPADNYDGIVLHLFEPDIKLST